MAWTVLGITLVYLWWLFRQTRAWQALPLHVPEDWAEASLRVTVLVAFRDEKASLPVLLNALKDQSYPHMKVILADDGSSDGSEALAQHWSERFPDKFRYLRVENPQRLSPKKFALSKAMEGLSTDIILTTDADCAMGSRWVESMVGYFEDARVQMVCGPVTFREEKNLFDHFQSLEFASLLGSGAAGLQRGKPSMCNGANLAYRYAAFQKAGGYEAHAHITSGDDEFLMHHFFAQDADSVLFAKCPTALVNTLPQPGLQAFVQQRKRWAGKWKHYQISHPRNLALGIFFFHLLWLFVPLIWYLESRPATDLYLSAFVLRAFGNFVFVKQVMEFLEKPFRTLHFLLLELLYSPYVVFFGLLANFGGYTWKGKYYGK
jgi:cellulose synthase/poly-beta-1,6-N-acetylglucosamine synthase-like glycosyltransferase